VYNFFDRARRCLQRPTASVLRRQLIRYGSAHRNDRVAAAPRPVRTAWRPFHFTSCLYWKLDSAIMVMKSAEDGRRYNVAHVPDGAMDRSVLVERPMSPQLIIVGGITMFRPSGGTFHSGWGCNVRPKRHAVTASGRLPAMIRCANSLSSASPACASAAHSATKSTTSPAPTACRGRHEPPALGRAPRRKNIWAL